MIVFEDEYLLVVNKPAGINTHAPSPFAGEGVYDWLRHRKPRWATLAIIHRLDKETSGVLVFGKTPDANRSLTAQFTQRTVRKKYALLTDRPVEPKSFTVVSALVRSGERYVSGPPGSGGLTAETRFYPIPAQGGRTRLMAEPVTGRTHQIRVQAAERDFPILGDTLYGGTAAPRLFLHAEELILRHPHTGAEMAFRVPAEFPEPADAPCLPHSPLREGLIDPQKTNAYRIVHGASDGWPGLFVDRLGEFLLSQSEGRLTPEQTQFLGKLINADEPSPRSHAPGMTMRLHGAYHKTLRRAGGPATPETCAQFVLGQMAPERFWVRENGLEFELSLKEGGSVGLFLDQRDNRRRFLVNHVGAGFSLFPSVPSLANLLNVFAYTCGFSVCAAKAGAKTTSIDLSKKYLEWGERNFTANQIDPAPHDFLQGEAFDWLRRLGKKQSRFDVIALDPPTFSRSKEHGVFRAEKDYPRLAAASLALLKPGGVLFCSTNDAHWEPEKFMEMVSAAARSAGRKILQQHYAPQAPDFPISRSEPAYLKTVWTRLQ